MPHLSPIICGIYLGSAKPKDLHKYLKVFIEEMGINIRNRRISVSLRCFVCDSPARAMIKDLHSQDEILSTFHRLQDEMCVKFFHTPANYTPTSTDKILFISNPEKVKDCHPAHYDFSGSVVEMTIGYRCINSNEIARIAVDMLKQSIEQTVPIINSYDLVKKFRQQRESVAPTSSLLTPEDRNFINAHYHAECGTLAQPVLSRRTGDETADSPQLTPENLEYYGRKLWPLGIVMYSTHPDILCGTLAQPVLSRRTGDETADSPQLTPENLEYYGSKLWPLGIVMYSTHPDILCGTLAQPVLSRRTGDETADSPQLTPENLEYYGSKLWPLGIVMYSTHPDIPHNDPDLKIIHHAMATIELASCVVFQRAVSLDVLTPKNLLWLGPEGKEMPELGFQEGNQTLKLRSLAHGAPGHTAHALSVLMRILGIPMMSNRFDRDNYVTVNWKHVERGKEHFLEKAPEASWLPQISYDFNSATHAPANYMCRDCESPIAAQTILPIQDHLWQKTLSMGHNVDLSEVDKQMLAILYGKQCEDRFLVKN